jgi:hypothetical protein
MNLRALLNGLGLFTGFAGSALLFFYWLPKTLEPGSERYRSHSGENPLEPSLEKRRGERFARLGLFLLAFGFLLQIFSLDAN